MDKLRDYFLYYFFYPVLKADYADCFKLICYEKIPDYIISYAVALFVINFVAIDYQDFFQNRVYGLISVLR